MQIIIYLISSFSLSGTTLMVKVKMIYICIIYFFVGFQLMTFTNCELSLLITEVNNSRNYKYEANCVVTEEDLESAVFWGLNPADEHRYIIINHKNDSINIESTEIWQKGNSMNFDLDPITDERWEDFKLLETKSKKTILENISENAVISVYANDEVQIYFGNSNSSGSYFATLGSTYSRLSCCYNCNNSFCSELSNHYNKTENFFRYNTWNHIKISLKNDSIVLQSSNNNSVLALYTPELNTNQIIFRSLDTAFWKLHKYDFYYGTEYSSCESLGHNFQHEGGTFCLTMFASMCKLCKLGIVINDDNSYIFDSKGKNNHWQKIVITKEINKGNIDISIWREMHGNGSGFWSIDKVRKCSSHELRVSTIQVDNLDNLRCASLNNLSAIVVNRTKIPEKYCPDGYLGQKCNINCDKIFGEKQSCEKYLICSEQGCNCPSGYRGENCSEQCPDHSWGPNCSSSCNNCNTCDDVTENCNQCIETCTEDLPILINSPILKASLYDTIIVEFISEYHGKKKPMEIQCQYRTNENNTWKWKNTNLKQKFIDSERYFDCTISNLKPGHSYAIRAILITDDGKFVTNEKLIPNGNFTTFCIDYQPTDIKITTNITSANIILINQDQKLCPLYSVKVSNNKELKKIPKFLNALTAFTNYSLTLNNLLTNRNVTVYFKTKSAPPGKIALQTVKSSVDSFQINWKEPSTQNGLFIYYKVEYMIYKYPICNIIIFGSRYNKMNTIFNNITLKKLEPFRIYQIKITAINDAGFGKTYTLLEQTQELDKPSKQELPSKITTDKTNIIVHQPNCNVLEGKLVYSLEFQCISYWCINETQIHKLVHYEADQITFPYPEELYPSSKYVFELKVFRKDSSNYLKYPNNVSFTSPSYIREVLVHSRNESNVWIRWKGSELYSDFLILAKSEDNTFLKFSHHEKCKLWKEYYCAVVGNLSKNTTYSINIKAKNQDEFEEENQLTITTIEEASKAPTNLKYEFGTNNTLELNWEHPVITNGPINQFLINLEVTNSETINTTTNLTFIKKNITFYNQTYYQIVDFAFSTSYNISIKAINKYEGDPAFLEVITPPPKPLLSASPFIQICTEEFCNITIPKPINLSRNSELFVVATNFLEEEKVSKELFNSTLQKNIFLKGDILKGYHWIERWIKIDGNEAADMNITIDRHNYLNNDSSAVLNTTKFLLAIVLVNGYKGEIVTSNNNVEASEFSASIYYETYQEKLIINGPLSSENLILLFLTLLLLLLLITGYLLYRNNLRKNEETINHEIANDKEENIELLQQSSASCKSVESINKFQKVNHDFLSKPIKVQNLKSYLKKSFSEEPNRLIQQHAMFTNKPTNLYECGLQEKNKLKNRFINITAYDHTRVILKKFPQNGSDYINANYIDGHDKEKAYIATQGPLQRTLNDFWQMIWQEDVKTIVMVANVFENDRINCEQYWPEFGPKIYFSEISVKNVKTDKYANYIFRTFHVMYKKQERWVQHLHFTRWPDNGIPMYRQMLIPFVTKIFSLKKEDPSPIVVHCSTGVGRTGTILLSVIALKMAIETKKVDFLGILAKLRNQRFYLVRNSTQYILAHFIVYECLFEFRKNFLIPVDLNFNTKVNRILNKTSVKPVIKYLEDVAWQDQILTKSIGNLSLLKNNESKNRFSKILPDSSACVTLLKYPENDESSTYINAVTVDTFHDPNRFIVTQQPLPNTVGDFWRLVFQYNVTVIVNLNEIQLDDMSTCTFWLEGNADFNPVDFITLKLVDEIDDEFGNLKIITLINKHNSKKQKINFLTMKGWKRLRPVPVDVKHLLYIKEKMINLAGTSDGPIVITCYDGVRASGLLVALSFITAKMKYELYCDVALAVRTIRHSRSQFVREWAQFQFLYNASLEYYKEFQGSFSFR